MTASVDDRREKTGICISGGGIRACAFGLGAMESLEERTGLVQGGAPGDRDGRSTGERRPADYLVAVSGGSYIAGAMAMLRSRFEHPFRNAGDPALNGQAQENPSAPFPRVFMPGSDETEYVRRRAQYLLRAQGGVIELISEFVVRLTLNLAFVALPIACLGWITGLLFGSLIDALPQSGPSPVWWIWLAVSAPFAVALVLTIVPMFSSASIAWGTRRRIVTACIGLGLLVLFLAVLPVLISALADERVESGPGLVTPSESKAGWTAIIASAGAVVAALAALWTTAQPVVTAIGRFPRLRLWAGRTLRFLVAVAAAVCAPVALVALFVWMAQQGASYPGTGGWIEPLVVIGTAGAWLGLMWIVEPTSWSLHPFYKRRLMSCFCIGWRPSSGLSVSERGYRTRYLWSGWTLPDRPELIIAAAANISTFGASPAGQNVMPFVISKREIGFSNGWKPDTLNRVDPLPGVGARLDTAKLIDTCRRGKAKRPWLNGERNLNNLTLSAAVAITGAAVSPSMGKRTIPPIRMLLALFNL